MLVCLLTIALVMQSPGAVKLTRAPQKFRSFYSIDDARIPSGVRSRLGSASQSDARRNARWRVEPDAIIRESPRKLRLSFKSGLPVGGLRAIAIASDGAVWAGGGEGLVRFKESRHPWDRWQYFGSKRYLPGDDVTAIAAGENGSVWVRTSEGVSHIHFRSMTMIEKAAYFEERIDERHKRHDLVADSELSEAGNPATSHQYPNDNDGLWTAIYVAAESFRYAVTKDQKALVAARRSVEAMMRLEEITGRRGFPARSFRHRSEPRHQDGEWHFTEDKEWEWKGDTSSDEMVGHFFAYAIAYDLLPDEELKKKLRRTVARIADHLIEHNYNLTDIDGKPTRWGRYGPDYFATEEGREEAALSSVELLSHFKVAHHITGDARYENEYRKLIEKYEYHKWATTYLKYRQELNYSDEELALLAFYPLFLYEKDASLLGFYREGLSQWWQNISRENNPLWIFIYAAANPGKAAPVSEAVSTLYRIPVDLTKWSVRNSHRRDVVIETERDRHNQTQTTTLLPPDERRVMKWNSNPFQLDARSEGRGEDDGAFFLLPYWMGRYHRFLTGQ